MDKKNANGFSLKASETGGQRKQLPYSVETPYGFHLDLDFLKYVDDIEKGNTIKRVHIQRRNKNPKFSTLPRNFSLPGHGSRTVPKDNRASTYTLGSKVKSRVVEVQQIYEFRPPDGGSVCYPRASGVAFKSIKAVEDATLQAFDEQPLGLHVRPHLLRASSMPVTVLRKNSEYMDIQGHKGSVGSYRENGSSENFFCSSDVVDRRANLPGEHPGLHQQFSTALQKIRELEEQVKTIPELKAQISALEEEKQQLLLRLNSQAIASRGNTRLQGELERTEHQDPRDARASNSKDAKPGPEHSASVQQPALSDKAVSTEDKSLPGTCNGRQQNEMISSSTQTVNVEAQNRGISSNFLTVEVCVAAEVITCDRAVETDPQELPCSSAKKNAGMAEESENAIGSVKLEKAVSLPVEGANCMVELRHHQQDDQKQLPYRDGEEPVVMHAAISQYVTKIQGLLNEQWACLGSGYPEIASTLKQPASKFSSIQTQLVSSLNALSSFCSSPGQKGGATRQAALKSIMKKNDCSKRAGNGGTKKNLKFVGVNGGYETTSSEESSAEDNVEEDSSESEERGEGGDRPAQDLTHTQSQAVKAQPAESRTTEAAEDPPSPSCEVGHQKEQLDRETVDEDFVAACLFLKDRLEEVASPDKEMRQVLMVLYQEWFRVSSQEDSHVDTVTLCLKEVAAAAPTLLCFLVNLADGNGNTALHYSVSHSNFSIVKLLLDTGLCDVDHQNKAGYTAIMLASLTTADSPEDMEVALQLLQQGNVNAQASQAGQTALMLAVSHGRTAMVRLLLDCQADVNVQDHDGSTALMCACENGHTDIVRLLLERDCDLNVMDKEGHTALSVALQASHSDVVDLLKANMDATASKPHEPL
ncbi:KN motif and ankyrin repeat domain-containing protein 4-like [Arapaima gigas]